jgi:hypothetical protein
VCVYLAQFYFLIISKILKIQILFSFKKYIIEGNVSELSMYIGDDVRTDGIYTITFPPYSESSVSSAVDYFSLKTSNAGLHHLFSSSGDYYCVNTVYSNNVYTYSNIGISGFFWFGISSFSNLDSNNSDQIYVKRNKIASNVCKLACYIADDGSSSLSNFPPTNESSATDYFSIRATNTSSPQHSFSSGGNYYCSNSIYCANTINGSS